MGRADHRSEHLRRQAEQVLAEYSGLAPWKRQVLARFLLESPRGWYIYVHRALPEVPTGFPEVLMIGPLGVLAVMLREQPPGADAARTVFRQAGELFLGARVRESRVSDAVVRPVLVLPQDHPAPPRSTFDHITVTVGELDRIVRRGERRLDKRDTHTLAEHLEYKTTEYTGLTLDDEQDLASADGELFDAAEIRQDRFKQALAGPFEAWLTFLDDSQFAMVRRQYSGPARISGPAGTGKSVVALHRLVHMAKRSTGNLLFTTYARNLPPIVQRSFQRLAPELDHRVQFTTLHSWAHKLLRDRDVPIEVDHRAAQSCFARAWSRVGRSGPLNELNSDWNYWWDEIDRVIKGRGLEDLADYQSVQRTGRGLPLERGRAREAMWDLYEDYERIRTEKGVSDFNDLLCTALNEIRVRPLDHPYSAVVVDEVQDITLIGLRLLHALGGDGPNGLLLVGDGQQQVYAGGWRLSDAGIPIRGRGEVLRTNYRNASRILDLAKQYDATNQVDDLDGNVGISLRDTAATLRGGHSVRWRGPRSDHEDALLSALRENTDISCADTAVLTFNQAQAKRWRAVLRKAGFPITDLQDFQGERNEEIKVGTIFRAKGLEFRAVFVPELTSQNGQEQGRERHERDQRTGLVALTRARDHLWVGFPESD